MATSRTLACPVPDNINPLSPNGFMFSIERLPELTYFCQEVSLPEVSLEAVDIATPFVRYPTAGDSMNFGELSVQFLVDSEMANYKAVFNWLRGLGFPENYDQYNEQITSSVVATPSAAAVSDATLGILGPGSQPIARVKFVDLVPVGLSSLIFSGTSTDVQYLIGNASFRYAYYTFE